MRQLRSVLQGDVWSHWKRVEGHKSDDFRSDIRSSLPANLDWYQCEVEQQDVDRLFIISSQDWSDISGGTFRVSEVAARLSITSTDPATIRIGNDIRKKMQHLDAGGVLDSQLIAITTGPFVSSSFTLIEGNRRSVAFLMRGSLVGSLFFVGSSPEVENYQWACHTYRRI